MADLRSMTTDEAAAYRQGFAEALLWAFDLCDAESRHRLELVTTGPLYKRRSNAARGAGATALAIRIRSKLREVANADP